MLVDCFPFFNELDMLECRLEYLNDKVDKFVLVEAYTTHMGKPKPLYFDENKERFAKYLDKIIHVKHNITVSKPSYEFDLSKNTDNAAWEADTDQRNAIVKGLVGLPDDAIVMISDVDEIPNKEAIDRAIRLLTHKNIVFLETKFFLYNLGQHLKELWPATSVCRNEIFTVKNTKPQMLRSGKDAYFKVLNGGWHLSYFGDVSRIQTKIQNFTHQEFNTEQFTDPEWIAERIRLGEDLYARPFPTVKVSADSFPEDFLKVFGKYLPEKSSVKEQPVGLPPKIKTHNIQLGSGYKIADNYLNVDFLDQFFRDSVPEGSTVNISNKTNCRFLRCDITKGIPRASEDFDIVYQSHVLEHMNCIEGYGVLRECFRILRSGGRMRILVPDLELWVNAYYNRKMDFLNQYRDAWLSKGVLFETPGQIFMGALHNHEHKMGYDFETLKLVLESIGFTNVVRTEYGQSDFPEIEFLEEPDDPKKIESLCLECEKPTLHYAETVEGWFSRGDMEFYKKVLDQAPDGAHFVEVGSYKGRSTSFMATEIKNSGKKIKFDCVDTWEGSEEHVEGAIYEDSDVIEGNLYDVFIENMKPVEGYYNPIRTTSLEAADLYADDSLDFVFIDAAHDYENVKADILAWMPKVKSGGIIGGHDFHHPPIKQAIAETLGEVNPAGGSWYVFKA